MPPSKATVDEIAGYLGVGFLQILGLFLALDGLTGFFSFIESYSKTNSWSLFVSISLIAMAYLMGLVSSNVLSTLFTSHIDIERSILQAVCEKDKTIIYELYN